jgi:hypothetical protein
MIDMRAFRILGLPAVLLGGLLFSSVARAADIEAAPPEPAPPPQDEWTLTVAPYFWAAGIDGDVGIFGQDPVNIDESFGDILKDLKFGAMALTELSNGTWGVFVDVIYAKTEADGSATRTIGGVPVALSASVGTSSFTGTIMGEYRIYTEPTATVDLMAGARIWDVDNDIDLALTAGGAPIAAFSGSDGATWVDPIVGAKARYNIDESWYLTGFAAIGGFGAGSDVTWDLLGGVGYQYNDWLSFTGYRALGVDYDKDGFDYDVVQHGPILGTVMKF